MKILQKYHHFDCLLLARVRCFAAQSTTASYLLYVREHLFQCISRYSLECMSWTIYIKIIIYARRSENKTKRGRERERGRKDRFGWRRNEQSNLFIQNTFEWKQKQTVNVDGEEQEETECTNEPHERDAFIPHHYKTWYAVCRRAT